MAPDWTRGDLRHRLDVVMVDPTSFTERGQLSGVKRGGNLNLTYYADKRMAAKIATYAEDDGYDGSAALRLVHVVSDYTGELWSETLGTFFVTSRTESVRNGFVTADYALDSMLYALEVQVLPRGFVVNKGASLLAAAKSIVTSCHRKVRVDGTARDKRAGSAIVYERGDSCLSAAMDLCSRCNNRLTVDANGTVVIVGYTAPANVAASFEVAEDSPGGMFIGPFEYEDNVRDTPERYIVASESEGSAVVGVAQVAGGKPSSYQVRGYTRDAFVQVSDLSPFNTARAVQLAKGYLAREVQLEAKASHSMRYRPLREGQTELLTANGTTKRWQIASAALDLGTWVWALDLKGGWNAT